MKRTASVTTERGATGGRRPSPNPGGTETGNLRTEMVRNSFTADDNKSKNILAWAGRVKELIGTYNMTAGHDASMGQLTRTTGYSDLLAACGVDSGDVSEQTKPTNFGTGSELAVPTTKPTAKQLVADKNDAEDGGFQTKQQRSLSRGDNDKARQTADRQELRRTSSSQTRCGGGNSDAARPASQTAVKPSTTAATTRDSSRSPDARGAQSRRSSVGGRATAERAISRAGSREPSSDSGGQVQPRRRLAARSSPETPPTPAAVCGFKQNDDDDDDEEEQEEKYSNNTEARDSTSRGLASTRRSYDDDNDKKSPTPTIRSKSRGLNAAEDRTSQRPAARMPPTRPVDVEEADSNESLSTIRNNSRLNATKARPQRSPARMPPPPSVDVEDKDSSDDGGPRTTDFDDVDSTIDSDAIAPRRDRGVIAGRRPQDERPSRPETTDSVDLMSRRDLERYQRGEPRLPTDVEEKDSDECLSERVSDPDMRQRPDNYPHQQRDPPPPQRVPRATAEAAYSTGPRHRGRKFDDYHQLEPRMPPPPSQRPIFTEENDSSESLSSGSQRRASDVDLRQQRARMMFTPQRTHSPPERLVDTSDTRRDYQEPSERRDPTDRWDPSDRRDLSDVREPSERRDQSLPAGRSRRRVPPGEGISNIPRPEAATRDAAISLPGVSTSPDRGRRPRTTSSGPPSPRPILRRTSPAAAAARQAGVRDGSPSAEVKKKKKKKTTSPERAPAAVHARPASGVPLRRAAANTDVVDDDADDDYLVNASVTRPCTGRRGLGKCSAATDLSDKLDQLTPVKRALANARGPVKSSSATSVRPGGSSVTPRRVWVFVRPLVMLMHRLFTFALAYARHELRELLRMPQVVEALNRMYNNWLRVMDDWALFTAVIFTVVCFFLVILLC